MVALTERLVYSLNRYQLLLSTDADLPQVTHRNAIQHVRALGLAKPILMIVDDLRCVISSLLFVVSLFDLIALIFASSLSSFRYKCICP